MKIIQLCTLLESTSGVTRYILELNNALKQIGHEVKIVCFNNNTINRKCKKFLQTIDGCLLMDYTPELIDLVNSADILLINGIPNKKINTEYIDNYWKLIRETSTQIKALCCNDHKSLGVKRTYGSYWFEDPEVVLNYIDKFIIFSPYNDVIQEIAKTYPKIMSKYVHLQHPYTFSEEFKVPYENKYRRVTYLGRFAKFKDPMRLIRTQQAYIDNNYQVEMRGISRMIGVAQIPDLFYELDSKKRRIGYSKKTINLSTIKAMKSIDPNDTECLIHYNDRDLSKIHIFGPYERSNGMTAVAHAMFGCDFCYNKKNPLVFGDNIEYAVAEIIDSGTIPMLDYSTMENCMTYENGTRTTTAFTSLPCGICLKFDCSNIGEVIEQMNALATNKEAYDKYRSDCLALYKKHYDPIPIAKRLIDDLCNPDNSHALKEFNYNL